MRFMLMLSFIIAWEFRIYIIQTGPEETNPYLRLHGIVYRQKKTLPFVPYFQNGGRSAADEKPKTMSLKVLLVKRANSVVLPAPNSSALLMNNIRLSRQAQSLGAHILSR